MVYLGSAREARPEQYAGQRKRTVPLSVRCPRDRCPVVAFEASRCGRERRVKRWHRRTRPRTYWPF